jgi:hypothetical protein
MSKSRKNDFVLVIIFPLVALFLSFLFKANFLISTLMFFGLPSIWLSFKHKRSIKKTLFFSAVFTIPLAVIIDYIMVVSGAWYIVDTIFTFRLFNIIVLEQFVWAFSYCYLIIIFYEYFFDTKVKESVFYFFGKHEKVFTKPMKRLVAALVVAISIFFVFLLINPSLLQIKYAYVLIGLIVFFIPLAIFLLEFPNLFTKFLKVSIYFFYLSILVELAGIKLNHWIFPGQYFVGWFNFFGHTIPLEEFFFYFVICAAAGLAYYEFFADDRK